jgi:hypothetical protein
VDEQFLSVPLHGGELSETGLEGGVVNGLGAQLLGEPVLQAQLADRFQIAGTRAEGETIEGLEDALVAAEFSGLIGPTTVGGGLHGASGLSACWD